jgi:hypothetical protein
VRLWNVAAQSTLLIFNNHKDIVWSVDFSPDGRRLASGSDDKALIVWEIENDHLMLRRRAAVFEHGNNWLQAFRNLDLWFRQECGKQCLEMTSGLTSPLPLGIAANLVALENREGRVPLLELRERRFSAMVRWLVLIPRAIW